MLHRTLDAHTADLARRPRHREQCRVHRAGRHRHRAETDRLAQDHGDERNRQARTGDEHAAEVSDLCGLFGLGADHEARCVAQRDHRQAVGVAELHEPSALVGAVGVDRPAEMSGIVGDDPDRSPFDAGERRHDRLAEIRSQLECRVDVGQCRDRVADLVDPLAVLGHDVAHCGLVVGFPVRAAPLEKPEIVLGERHRMCLVVGEKVDHAVGRLHVNGPDVLWPVVPEPAAFDHRRTRHAKVGIRGRDDDVADAGQRRITGETASADDRNGRHRPAQARHPGERMQLQTGQERRVGVARTAAAALSEQHQRHLQLIDDRQQAVLFLVAPEPLRAGEDGVVVRHHTDQRRLLAKVLGVDRSQTADDAVARRVADQVVDISTAFLGGVHEAAVLLKAARVDKVCQVLTGGSTPAGVDLRNRLRPGLIIEQRPAGVVLRKVGPLACSAIVGIVGGGGGRSNRLLLQDRQNLSRLHDLSCRDANLGNHALRRRLHQPLDLHHLDDRNRRPGRHRITRLWPDLDDGAVGRSDDLVAHDRRVSRSHTRPTENIRRRSAADEMPQDVSPAGDQPRRRVSSGSSRAALTLG